MSNNEVLKVKHVEVLDALSKLREEYKVSRDGYMVIGRLNDWWVSHFTQDLRQVKLPHFTNVYNSMKSDLETMLNEHTDMVAEQVEFESLLFILGKSFRKTQITQRVGLHAVIGHIGLNACRNWVYSNDIGVNNHATLAGAFYGKDYLDER